MGGWFNPALPHTKFEAHNGESEGAQHFCKIHYPFGLKKPYCKCMCATKESVVQQCNHDRTVCHLVASETLKAQIATQTGFTASNTPAFAQAAGLSADPVPYVVKHAQGNANIQAHQEHNYNAGDLALAKAARGPLRERCLSRMASVCPRLGKCPAPKRSRQCRTFAGHAEVVRSRSNSSSST